MNESRAHALLGVLHARSQIRLRSVCGELQQRRGMEQKLFTRVGAPGDDYPTSIRDAIFLGGWGPAERQPRIQGPSGLCGGL